MSWRCFQSDQPRVGRASGAQCQVTCHPAFNVPPSSPSRWLLNQKRRCLRVPWTARRSKLSILKEISPEYSLEGLIWSWNSNTLATWWEELTHWKRPWCWERLKAGGKGDDRWWDGWMAWPTGWMWVWASSRSWWWTGKPGVLQSMGHKESDTTEQLNWTDTLWKLHVS